MMPPPSGVVTLLTDFGTSDPFVGIMKGVLLREEPSLNVIDVSHGVPPQDLDVAAFWLAHGFGWFPIGTVHVCVVDPGVGGTRAPLAASAAGHWFVAPDNGVLSEVLAERADAKVHRIEPAELGLSVPSRTFHGRDVFAPVAAWLASGRRALADLGPPHVPVGRALPEPRRSGGVIEGRVVFADHYGNLITDIPGKWLAGVAITAEIRGRRLERVGTYADAAPGQCVALVSSFDTLEIACRDGSAARALGAARGERVTVTLEGAR